MAIREARANFNKDQAFSFWATFHGGVYVPVDSRTPPNPNLSHIPERDIITPSGKALTLMNHAYMVRQLMHHYSEQYGIRGRITSLNPLWEGNAPDDWETKALRSFEEGVEEVFEFNEIDGEPYLRLMRPMIAEKGCLKCHGFQGYMEGDIRGGVGVSVPMAPLFAIENRQVNTLYFSHGLIWLLGLVGIGIGEQRVGRGITERRRADEALRESEGRYRSLFEDSPVSVWEVDCSALKAYLDGLSGRGIGDFRDYFENDPEEVLHCFSLVNVIDVNNHTLDIFEAESKEEFLAGIATAYHEDSFEDLREGLIALAQGERLFECETVNRTMKGREIDIAIRWSLPRGYEETQVIVFDITKRKRAEEALRRLSRDLNESQRVAQIGGWDWDAVNDTIWWSDEYYRIYGHDPKKPTPNYVEHLKAYTPESAKRLDDVVKRAMDTGEPYELDLELAVPTESTRWIVARGEAKRDADGKIWGLRGTAQNITERKQAEEDLKRLNERFTLAVNAAHLGVWDWDISKNELVWDDRMYALYGIRREYFSGAYEAWLNGVHPEDRALSDETSKRALAGEIPYDTEFRVVWPDGSVHHLKAYGLIVRDEEGRPLRMTGINYDITGLRQAEEERQRYLRFFESMDRINSAILGANDLHKMMSRVLDVVLSVLDCDRAFLMYPCDPDSASWGVPMERNKPEYPGVFELGLIMPMDANVAETLRILLASDGPVKFGPGTGHALPADVSEQFGFKCFMSMALYPKVGKPWQFGVHQCSYARTWTPEEEMFLQGTGMRLADALTTWLMFQDLRDREGKLSEAQRIAHIGYWDRDIAANRVTLSDEACRIFGLSPQDINLTLEQWHKLWLELIHPEDRQRVEQATDDTLRGDKPYDVEYRIVRPGGEVRFVHSEANVTRDYSGHPIRMLVMVQDITEKRKLEAQLRQSQKMEAVGRFTGGIAHDFNNILTAIIGFGEFLKEGIKDEPFKTYLDMIRSSAERATTLTHSLLAFSREQISNPKPVDLNEVVSGVQKILERLIGEDIRLLVRLVDRPLVGMADRGQMEQVLINLATNARDAMPGGGTLTISTGFVEMDREFVSIVEYGKPGPYCLISVADTGHGMDEKTREKIFEPFFTTKEVGKGTGLGLSVVYGIIRQHDGHINVYSEPDRGTTFKIYLPVIEEKVKEIWPKEPLAIMGGTETLLVAEDDEFIRNLLKMTLEKAGYTVIEATNGKDAVEKFMENKDNIDLLLFDVVMPLMDGKKAHEEIVKASPDIKALFMSGYTADYIKAKGIFEEGMNFVSKPVSPSMVLARVREVLGKR